MTLIRISIEDYGEDYKLLGGVRDVFEVRPATVLMEIQDVAPHMMRLYDRERKARPASGGTNLRGGERK